MSLLAFKGASSSTKYRVIQFDSGEKTCGNLFIQDGVVEVGFARQSLFLSIW